MARGGFRPGAGRPKKNEPRPEAVMREAVQKCDSTNGQTPLEYMLSVMRDAEEDPARRDRMAMAAAPFVHQRAADVAQGKKEAKAKAAETAGAGKFAAAPPPKLKLVG